MTILKGIVRRFKRRIKQRRSSLPEWPPGHRHLYEELFDAKSIKRRRFYNVGAGMNFLHPAWTNVGQPSKAYGHRHVDLEWDLQSLDPMPLPSNSAEIIYSRYTLEHVVDEAVQNFLNEAFRALRSGGFLRVIVPDIEILYAAYKAKDPVPFHKPKRDRKNYPNRKFKSNPNTASFEQRFLWQFASGASELHQFEGPERISDVEFRRVFKELPLDQALDYCTARCAPEFQRTYPQFHINWFHANKLDGMMRAAGFTEPYRSAVGESRSPVLRDLNFFDDRRPEIGLFMEAVK
jgi:predicted SAM-dependent methyltransferase